MKCDGSKKGLEWDQSHVCWIYDVPLYSVSGKWHVLKYAKDPIAWKLYAYRLSQDQAGHIGKGRKSAPSLELESYEDRLTTKEIVGNAQTGIGGLGLRPRKKQSLKDKRKELVKLMKEDAENQRIVDLGSYEIQAKWLSVGIDEMQRKISPGRRFFINVLIDC